MFIWVKVKHLGWQVGGGKTLYQGYVRKQADLSLHRITSLAVFEFYLWIKQILFRYLSLSESTDFSGPRRV